MDYFSEEHRDKRIEDVRQFMTTFHQPFPIENKERESWLKSEFLETMEAAYNNDPVGVLDGYIDFEYVACGMALETGGVPTGLQETLILTPMVLVFEGYPKKYETILCQAWDAVHRANMRKLWNADDMNETIKIMKGKLDLFPTGDKFAVLIDGKVKKPPGWVGPEEELKKLVDGLK